MDRQTDGLNAPTDGQLGALSRLDKRWIRPYVGQELRLGTALEHTFLERPLQGIFVQPTMLLF